MAKIICQHALVKLDQIALNIALCLKTRTAGWHVLSLYPGETQLKQVRKEEILESIENLHHLAPHLSQTVESEIGQIKSLFNRQSTLDERKSKIREKLSESSALLFETKTVSQNSLVNSEKLLLKHDQPTRLIFEVQNGCLVGARELPSM